MRIRGRRKLMAEKRKAARGKCCGVSICWRSAHKNSKRNMFPRISIFMLVYFVPSARLSMLFCIFTPTNDGALFV